MTPHNKSPADSPIGRDHTDKGTSDSDHLKRASPTERDDVTRGKSSDGDDDEEMDQARGEARGGLVNDDDDWSRQR